MTVAARAKFICKSETLTKWSAGSDTHRAYELQAVYDTSTPENARFTKATPTGTLTLGVDNPDVTFELGKEYYLDFTPVDPAIPFA